MFVTCMFSRIQNLRIHNFFSQHFSCFLSKQGRKFLLRSKDIFREKNSWIQNSWKYVTSKLKVVYFFGNFRTVFWNVPSSFSRPHSIEWLYYRTVWFWCRRIRAIGLAPGSTTVYSKMSKQLFATPQILISYPPHSTVPNLNQNISLNLFSFFILYKFTIKTSPTS